MSTVVVESLKSSFLRAWGLMGKFISVCPEDIWAGKSGGWPVWQSVYHSLMSVYFFVPQEGGAGPHALYPSGVASLEEVSGSPAPAKEELQSLHASVETVVLAYLDGLTDADLARSNEGLSARTKLTWTHASSC
ncbi:MAG: DinB family protein, partial [Deltaproteobacteria bacterium]|nr:DinB family protein [Deltaproteobacteria bacterium]